jgi:hypothetical protein
MRLLKKRPISTTRMLYANRASSGIVFLRSYRSMRSLGSCACGKAAVTPFPVIGSDCEAASPIDEPVLSADPKKSAALEGCHRGRLGQAMLDYSLKPGDLRQSTKEQLGSRQATDPLHFDSATGRYIAETVDPRPNWYLPDPLHVFGGTSKRVKSSALDLLVVPDMGLHRHLPRTIADRRKPEFAAE